MVDHIRALLIGAHLLAVGLAALPAPSGVKRSNFDDPLTEDALAPVLAIAQDLGYPGDYTAFADDLYVKSKAIQDLRGQALAPFGPYYKYAGTKQSWRMFGAVNANPARVEFYLDRGDGQWQPLYIARDPEHDWRAMQFDQERFRAFMNDYSWKRDNKSWVLFNTWVARQAAADFPGATRLKGQVRYRPIVRPEVLRTLDERPSGKVFWPQTTDLKALRQAEDSP